MNQSLPLSISLLLAHGKTTLEKTKRLIRYKEKKEIKLQGKPKNTQLPILLTSYLGGLRQICTTRMFLKRKRWWSGVLQKGDDYLQRGANILPAEKAILDKMRTHVRVL